MALILGLPIQGQSTDTLLFESNRTSFGTQAVVFEPGSAISYGLETSVLGHEGVSGSYSFPSAVMGAPHALPDGVHLVSRGGWLHGGIGSGVLLHSTHTVESVAADPENHAFLIVGTSKANGDSRLFQDHSGTLKLASTFEGPRGVQCLHRVDTRLFLVAAGTHSTEIHTTVNPAAGGSTNAPPVAALGSSPPEATTAAALRFDAGAPSDESPTSLRYRWDWESDGRYDTEWTNAPVQEHRFLNGDKDSVRLQMKDSFGATSLVQRSVEVVTVPDPGIPAESHEPFALPFRAADIAFDPGAPFAYLADTNTLRILRMDLRTGLADRQYVLDKWPLKLALSPDGDTLIVALSPSARLMRTGYVAEFALPTAVKRREFPIDTGLSALMVGPDDLLIGSAPEGIVVYRLGETRRLDQESTSLVSSFTPSPSPTNFYAFNAFGISRWELDATTGRLHPEGTLSITSQIGDDLFLIPGGTNALSGAGRLLASAPLAPPSQDLKTVRTVHDRRRASGRDRTPGTAGAGFCSFPNPGSAVMDTHTDQPTRSRIVVVPTRRVGEGRLLPG